MYIRRTYVTVRKSKFGNNIFLRSTEDNFLDTLRNRYIQKVHTVFLN